MSLLSSGNQVLIASPSSDSSFCESRYNKFLLIIAYASVPMNIMLCMGIYYSTFFQHILSNMYNYYGVICTVYIIIYVFILNYWIRNWSRDLLKARLDPKELRRLKDQIY